MLVDWRGVINTANPYHPPETESNSNPAVAKTADKRRFLDIRCLAVSLLSVMLGAAMWKVQSYISGNAIFDPDFFAMLGWFIFSGFVTGLIDPRSPWISWLSLYFGTYILALPFFPRDPLIPLALILGAIFTGICVVVGTLIPSTIAYLFPLTSPTLRRWAGYTK